MINYAKKAALAVLSICFLGNTTLAQAADNYPTQAIKIVLPFGGGAEAVARVVADAMADELGATVVAESQPGAGGTIAASQVARAKPDGYTLLWGTHVSQVSRPLTMLNPPYDAIEDFTSIAQISMPTYGIAVNKSLGISTLQELIDYSKQNPDTVTVGTFGSPALGQLFLAQLKKYESDFDALNIPFKDEGQAVAAAMGHHITAVIGTLSSLIASGDELQILALMTDERRDGYGDIPAVTEYFDGFIPLRPLSALWGPADMPEEVVTVLNKAAVAAVNRPEVRELLISGGSVPSPGTPAELDEALKNEIQATSSAIKEAGIELE